MSRIHPSKLRLTGVNSIWPTCGERFATSWSETRRKEPCIRTRSAQIPVLSGFGAGYPDYPWFFGTDGAYTVFPLAAIGQWDEAKDHLNTIRQVSQIVNGTTGKVLHEIVTDGSIYFGDQRTKR